MQLIRSRIEHLIAVAASVTALSMVVSCSGDDGMEPPPPPPTPRIDTISANVVSPGDTILLTGKNFATPVEGNTVFFDNKVYGAKPFRSTGDSLEVEVPDNANSGGMYVRSLGVRSNDVTVEVLRGVGEPWIVGEGTGFDLKLPTPQGNERYLVVPYSAQSGAVLTYQYTVTPDTTSVFPAPPVLAAAGEPMLTLREAFEGFIWDQTEAYLNSDAPRRRFEMPKQAASPEALMTFSVLKCQCSNDNANNFETVTAELKYSGANTLIYADVNQPTGSYTQADYDTFGQQFDNTTFPNDTTAFGPPTDIDNNDRVIILFSPVVNKITPPNTWDTRSGYVSGFFLPNDLAPNRYAVGTSNSAEMFYAIVPDPNNEFGNDFDRNTLLAVIPGTLAHEFEHMISFGYRYWTLGSGNSFAFAQERWFEEGMAHIAEDVNGFDSQNIPRANRYINFPLSQKSLFEGDDSLEQRGGIFLFLRYLGDRYGEQIYREFVETACVGQACTIAVLDEDFPRLVGDFLATLYLSDRGITNDPRYNYSSFNFQTTFAPVIPTARDFGAGAFSGSVRSGAGQFWLLLDNTAPAASLMVSASSGSRMRLMVVRTQ